MSEVASEHSVSRLASDGTRSWIAAAIVIFTAVVTAVVSQLIGAAPNIATVSALLVSWALYGLTHFVLTLWAFRRLRGDEFTRVLVDSEPQRRGERAARAAAGGGAGSYAGQASLLAVIAIAVVAFDPALRQEPIFVAGGVAVVVSSWTLMVTSYAVQYAREHARRRSFSVEIEDPQALGDWFYLSVQMSTSFSPAEVRPLTRRARRMVTGHAVIAFVFYAIVVALTVSVLVGALG